MIGISRDGDVVTIELQRPERRNALNEEMLDLLRDGVEDAVDGGARAVVLTGQGSVFCAGADLSVVYSETFTDKLLDTLHTVDSVPVPVIAAVNGAALGAGTQLAIASDLRVAAPDAFFGVPPQNWASRWTGGRCTDSRHWWGPARRGRCCSAWKCSTRPTRTRTVSPTRSVRSLDAQAWAKTIAGLAPLTLAHLKMAFNDDGTQDEESHELRAALFRAWQSEDAKEGRLARKEKRPPRFTGN